MGSKSSVEMDGLFVVGMDWESNTWEGLSTKNFPRRTQDRIINGKYSESACTLPPAHKKTKHKHISTWRREERQYIVYRPPPLARRSLYFVETPPSSTWLRVEKDLAVKECLVLVHFLTFNEYVT